MKKKIEMTFEISLKIRRDFKTWGKKRFSKM